MATLVGDITEAGEPVARLIRVYDHALGGLVAETTSNSAGHYAVGLTPGEYDIMFLGTEGKQNLAHGPLIITD